MVSEKYLIGSTLLGFSNSESDKDYLVIDYDNKDSYYLGRDEENNDLFYYGENLLNSVLNFNTINKLCLYNINYDKTIRGENNKLPFDYNILEHLDKLKLALKYFAKRKLFNFDKKIKNKNGCMYNKLYLFAYNVFICVNNSVVLTSEQRQIVQDIHDGIKDINYIDTLKLLINNF